MKIYLIVILLFQAFAYLYAAFCGNEDLIVRRLGLVLALLNLGGVLLLLMP